MADGDFPTLIRRLSQFSNGEMCRRSEEIPLRVYVKGNSQNESINCE